MKNYKEFLNESFFFFFYDYLEINFQDIEDCGNEDDANGLFSELMNKYPNVEPSKIREIAYHWVGLNEEKSIR
jgi:hypothetical protein